MTDAGVFAGAAGAAGRVCADTPGAAASAAITTEQAIKGFMLIASSPSNAKTDEAVTRGPSRKRLHPQGAQRRSRGTRNSRRGSSPCRRHILPCDVRPARRGVRVRLGASDEKGRQGKSCPHQFLLPQLWLGSGTGQSELDAAILGASLRRV